ncbi:hypothetical protein [Sphingomonas sanxanigenens]|uniref:Uncharacterized protein n=1 Tax=Sphingomonas sanxanigenens DSM 19645 = NX02 TaxID=1123269 RepID=W0AFP2_9SPHN|nr:hypothetical protein [Sphingomonas sanxanigenens]AHE55931.1 hypothetical protein NX02_21500 [Sphingomonas sanxanigenens DSM 19645 = NX02]
MDGLHPYMVARSGYSREEIWQMAAGLLELNGEQTASHVVAMAKAASEAGQHENVALWISIADCLMHLEKLGDEPAGLH